MNNTASSNEEVAAEVLSAAEPSACPACGLLLETTEAGQAHACSRALEVAELRARTLRARAEQHRAEANAMSMEADLEQLHASHDALVVNQSRQQQRVADLQREVQVLRAARHPVLK